MAELNLKQIQDKLNEKFVGENRKLIFWYDDNAEFEKDIESLDLVNASVYHLERNNQFRTKVFLERQDKESNYLIYSPFPKPPVEENHLEDMLLYSEQFYVDRPSLIVADLGIDEQYKSVFEKYIKFFREKGRTQRFYELNLENITEENIELGLMSVLCKTRTISFDEILRVILTDGSIEDNQFLLEFKKYDLLTAFWRICNAQFGYTDPKPSLEKLLITIFVSYTERYLGEDLPRSWRSFSSYKSGNIIAFVDNLMNNILYRNRFDELSIFVASKLNAKEVLAELDLELLIECDVFAIIDDLFLNWITERLKNEDTGVKLRNLDIPNLCTERCKTHFGEQFDLEYKMLIGAFYVINAANYNCPDHMIEIIKQYREKDYLIDSNYRAFYFAYDQIDDVSNYEELRDLVENIYTNEYLFKQLPKWTSAFAQDEGLEILPLQRKFFNHYVRSSKVKLVVIISDALRYEAAEELYEKLNRDAKCTAKIDAMMSVLPSVTSFGMAALLPHKSFEITDNYKVLLDGRTCEGTKQREQILQGAIPASRCIQYDDLTGMKQANLREIFTGMEVVYVYHNQVDARGDKANTENEVFKACDEAIEEIYGLIKRLSTNANVQNFIVTADHGFIYKRDKLNESDKISSLDIKQASINRRYILSDNAITGDGIASEKLNRMLGNQSDSYVSFPVNANVFKVQGGGQNYVHGGCSPQEMLVPLIQVKTEKGYVETHPAKIALVSVLQKISNLITSIDFFQMEPINDVVKETSYKIFFVSEDNERISNECIYIADKTDIEPQKRIFRLRFDFKNKKYAKDKHYYLVAYDVNNDVEIMRHTVAIDLAFANDFGFDV